MQKMLRIFWLQAKYRQLSVAYGFTLIELIVVMGILSVMSTVVLANHAQFGDKLLLRNLAYEVALSVREMQVFGISARKSFMGVVTNQKRAHGVYFNANTPTSYLQFADTITGTAYLYDGSGELLDSLSINPKYILSDLCVRPIGGTGYTCGLSTLHISFVRPNPDAMIRVNNDAITPYEEAKIMITTRRSGGDTRAVIVGAAGQISVIKITN